MFAVFVWTIGDAVGAAVWAILLLILLVVGIAWCIDRLHSKWKAWRLKNRGEQ